MCKNRNTLIHLLNFLHDHRNIQEIRLYINEVYQWLKSKTIHEQRRKILCICTLIKFPIII